MFFISPRVDGWSAADRAGGITTVPAWSDKMAGIKEFDRSEVLDRAMALSWTRGEEATSIQDLVQATGVAPGCRSQKPLKPLTT
jgi:hypothetical protein